MTLANEIGLALANLMEAQKNRDEAFADNEGTWGYYGQNYEDNLSEAHNDFDDVLKGFINKQICEALSNVPEFLAKFNMNDEDDLN